MILIKILNIFYCARHKDREFLKELLSNEPQNEELFNQFKSDLIPFNTDFELGDVQRSQNISTYNLKVLVAIH